MKKTLAWYKRFVHDNWKIELKLREEEGILILHCIEKYYQNNKHSIINYGEICPENMEKAINGLKNYI